ncbi:MAG: glycosyltransferase [Pseudomonadota bacterium]
MVGTESVREVIALPDELKVAPLVSVVVTNFNYAAYVGMCVRSIASQTYSNFECVIVDDKSNDGSIETIKAILAEIDGGDKYHLIELPENSGQMNAFAEGLAQTTGAFVVFVDADDCLFPTFLETHLQAHLSRDCTSAMTCSDAIIIDGSNQVLAGLRRGRVTQAGERSRLSRDMPIDCNLLSGWNEDWRVEEDALKLSSAVRPLRYVSPVANFQRVWIWTSTSSVMFRRSALDLVLSDRVKNVRISADFYLFQFCHLIGGTVLIQCALGAYRRHGKNSFAQDMTISHRTISGRTKSYEPIWQMIRKEVLTEKALLRDLLGRPRFIAMVAILFPPKAFMSAWSSLGRRDVAEGVTLATHMIRNRLRTLPRRMRRAFE